MKIPLSKKTKIYIVAPARAVTGGPEDLHQLAVCLRMLYPVDKVLMHYMPVTVENPVPPPYARFNVEFTREIEDNATNVLIIPEIYITKFDAYQHIQKVVWWLSVDNYYLCPPSLSNRQRRINNVLFKFGMPHHFFFNNDVKKIKWHLAQSQYAFEHFKKKGIENIMHLTNYTNQDFLKYSIDETIKKDIVAYNPKKGFSFTKRIIASLPDIEFIPLVNMSHEQMANVLKKAKVYIDFGFHPGMDKIPREASILRCCIITGKRGSAGFFDDVPIPPDFKFRANWFTIPLISRKIRECFRDYHNQARRLTAHRERAKKYEDTHRSDVQHAFSFDPRA